MWQRSVALPAGLISSPQSLRLNDQTPILPRHVRLRVLQHRRDREHPPNRRNHRFEPAPYRARLRIDDATASPQTDDQIARAVAQLTDKLHFGEATDARPGLMELNQLTDWLWCLCADSSTPTP